MRVIKYLILLLLIGFFYLINHELQATEVKKSQELIREGKGLSLEDCVVFSAKNSFAVRLAKLDFLIAQTGQGVAEAIYDTILSLDVSYENDKSETASTLAGDHVKTNSYSLGISKDLPIGTELDLTFSDQRKWTSSSFVTNNPTHTAEVVLEARQPLGKNSFGYINRRNISVTSLAIENADLDTKEKIETLFADVEGAFWQWLFYQENLQIHQQILARAKELHQANDKNYDIGRIEKGDFLASQVNVLIREKDLLLAENEYSRAEEEMKLLLNMQTGQKVYPQGALEYRKRQIDLEESLVQAFAKRRDYLKAKKDVEIKNLTLETKSNARWPEIDLVASLATNGIASSVNAATRRLTNQDNLDYYTGLEFSMPLENRLTRSEFTAATHDKERAIVSLKQVERTIVAEVGNAVGDYETFSANLTNLLKAAELQQEKLFEEEKRFRFGRSDTKRVIDYQGDYLDAQLSVARGIVDLEIAKVELEKILNIILDKYGGLL